MVILFSNVYISMVLSEDQKNFLEIKRDSIKQVFLKYYTTKVYMGVYVNNKTEQPYITFNSLDTFKPVLKMAGNTHTYCCTYVCAQDFDIQTDSFLV